MWMVYVFLVSIASVLFKILCELHAFALITSFNLAVGRKVAGS